VSAKLFRLDQGDISFRSPALAEFIVKRVAGARKLFDVARRALFKLNDAYADDPEFSALSRALLKFSFYGRIFQGENLYELAEAFYDECRVLKIAHDDPLFLVQRSICNMNSGHFGLSEKYVETAYGLAKRRFGFDTYQIDTHKAKLLLTISYKQNISKDVLREIEAQDLLDAVIGRKNDDLYHPLSVMRLYVDIVHRWCSSMTPNERAILGQLVDRSIRHINNTLAGGVTRFRGLKTLRLHLTQAREQLR
jgi:hypothetical protein